MTGLRSQDDLRQRTVSICFALLAMVTVLGATSVEDKRTQTLTVDMFGSHPPVLADSLPLSALQTAAAAAARAWCSCSTCCCSGFVGLTLWSPESVDKC